MSAPYGQDFTAQAKPGLNNAMKNTIPNESGRAPRYAIQMPLRYRVRGQLNWHEGRMENISRSGVLFRGAHTIEPNAAVEMSFLLPANVPNEPAAEVICSGRIVRAVPPSGSVSQPAFAARIWDYRFVRSQDVIKQ